MKTPFDGKLFKKVCEAKGLTLVNLNLRDLFAPEFTIAKGEQKLRVKGVDLSRIQTEEDMGKVLEANAHRLLHPEHWGAAPVTPIRKTP